MMPIECYWICILCKEFELADYCERWLECLKNRVAIKIPDVEKIQEENPEEYKLYQRLGVQSILAVPFWKRPMGFLALRNPKRYQNHGSLLRLLNHAIGSALNEFFLMETNKLAITSPRIENDTDVYISMFGELKITTSKGVLTEQELKSPKIVRMLVYLLLSQKSASAPREIADAIWPHEESDALRCSRKKSERIGLPVAAVIFIDFRSTTDRIHFLWLPDQSEAECFYGCPDF